MFGAQLKKLRNDAGISQSALALKLSVSQQTIASWEVDRSSPSPEMLSLIADVFGVSTDYLLGKTDKKTADTSEDVSAEFLATLSPETRLINDLVNQLPDEKRQEVIDYIRFVVSRSKQPPHNQ